MAAFNVTALSDKGYSSNGRFSNPMTQEFRAKPYSVSVTDIRRVRNELKKFAEMNAYNHKN
jgi:hypothetical protein